MNHWEQLNEGQALAVRHADGPMLVLAGPGSGKTKVLTERVHFLIEERHVPPEAILVITFSKKAALEMRQRFFGIIGDTSYPVNFGTFHAFFFHILKHCGSYQENNILTPIQKRIYVEEAGRELQIAEADDLAWQEEQLFQISCYKNAGENLAAFRFLSEEERSGQFLRLYESYRRRCLQEGMLDFDDMLIHCLTLLKENPVVLRRWQETYRYLLVDEFQDSNPIQYEIVRLLLGSSCNLFAVGDDDQSIYGFRGASPDVMQKLLEDFPFCSRVELSHNYRCNAAIIKAADALIAKNTCRIAKQSQSPANRAGEEGRVEIRRFVSMEAEAEFVADKLKQLYPQGFESNNRQRTSVLYRITSCGNLLEEKLILAGIPYERQEKQKSFYEEDWVVDLLTYLKIASGSRERSHFYRILNRPPRGLSRECITGSAVNSEEMIAYYEDRPAQAKIIKRFFKEMETISRMTPFAAVNYVLKGVRYGDYLRQRLFARGITKDAVMELTQELFLRSREFQTIGAWLSYIEELRQEQERKSNIRGIKSGKAGIVLQTIHAAKGLEYDTVFVIGLQEGILPHKKAMTKQEVEEERRLLYVAMTRAKNRLYLCARDEEQYGKGISRFVRELGLTILEQA